MDSEQIIWLVVGALFALGAIWLLWRIAVWCLFLVSVVSLRLTELPPVFYIPLMVILALIAWPIALLALFGWLLMAIFPGLAPPDRDDPNWKPRLRERKSEAHDSDSGPLLHSLSRRSWRWLAYIWPLWVAAGLGIVSWLLEK